MAYSGSTAASSVANPPSRVSVGLLSQRSHAESTTYDNGGQVWFYNSTNLTTDLGSTGFFSDAIELGMRNGDVVICVTRSTDSSTGVELVIGTLRDVSTGGASLSTAAGIISSTFG